eukprot:9449210-Prorocentrum_lima.AAC.1
MTSSLVGSEMCIRDRRSTNHSSTLMPAEVSEHVCEAYFQAKRRWHSFTGCLLYTSDAADDM